MRARLLTSLDELPAVEDGWRDLAESAGNAFLSPEWFRCWQESAGAGADWAVAVVPGEAGKLDGVLPLVLEGSRRRRTIRFPEARLGDHFHPLARYGDESSVAAAAAEELRRAGERVGMTVLLNIDRGARWPRALWAGRAPKTNRQSESELPFVTLPGTWDDYLAARSANFRQQIRRRERKLAKLGDLRLRAASVESLEADMATLFRLHLLRWEGRGRSALADPAAQEFLRRFARAAQERGWLRLHTMELDGEPVAAFLGWRLGARYAFYQSGFDPAHADHSVGSVILAMTIRSAIEEGAHEFDMLLGTEPYKRRFTDRARPVETVVVAGARSARGLLLTGEAAARRRGRELARRPRLEAAVRKVASRMPSAWRS